MSARDSSLSVEMLHSAEYVGAKDQPAPLELGSTLPAEDIVYRKSRGISIDNYDPNDRSQVFTDPLTIEAMQVLGVKPEELFYPTNRDLLKYTRDKDMRDVVKQQLFNRVKKSQDEVRAERDRIARKPPAGQVSTRDERLEELTRRTERSNALEQERMARIQEKNKREAEQIILSILIENEMIEETLEQQERDKQERLRQIQETRLWNKQERERQRKKERDAELREIEQQKEAERKRREAFEADRKSEEKRIEMEKARRAHFEQLDQERMRKNEEARKNAEKFEEKRRQEWDEQRKQQMQRDKEWEEKRKKERQELEEKAKLEEQRKQERVAQVRSNQEQHLEEKRTKTMQKQEKQEIALKERHEARMHELEVQKKMEEEREKQSKEYREKLFQEQEEAKKNKYEASELRSTEYYRKMQEDKDKRRRQLALEQAIRREERVTASNRLAKKKESSIMEIEKQYEARLKAIQMKEQMRLKQKHTAEVQRNKLARQKYELEAGLVSAVEMKKKGMGALKKIADEMGIDLKALQLKAKAVRREKHNERERSSLPPIRPASMINKSTKYSGKSTYR